MMALAIAALLHPLRSMATFFKAQQLSPPGLAQRLKHVVYAAEAVLLAREMTRRHLQHVHVHMANNGAMVALLATELDRNLSYSLTIHGSAEFFNVEQVRLKAKAEGATFVRCISSFCRAQVMTWTDPSAWSRFHVVHCGVDPQQYTPGTSGDNHALRLLTVGRMASIKGYHVLLQSCRTLSDRGIPWTLTMVGDGPMRPSLERMTQGLGIEEHVKFAGSVGQHEIPAYLEACDAMVVSSFMEGVPVVLMEAMAKAVAVVATNVGGIGELIDPGRSGWLVPAGDAAALADAMAAAATDRERLKAYGACGRAKVCEEFAIVDVADQMRRLFQQYLAAPEADPAATPAAAAEPSPALASASKS
jgi:glycosyltransferase involved in cell wall biosynthesis